MRSECEFFLTGNTVQGIPKGMKVEITRLECKRCGHVWIPKQEEVRICPHCKSPYWDKERRKKKEK